MHFFHLFQWIILIFSLSLWIQYRSFIIYEVLLNNACSGLNQNDTKIEISSHLSRNSCLLCNCLKLELTWNPKEGNNTNQNNLNLHVLWKLCSPLFATFHRCCIWYSYCQWPHFADCKSSLVHAFCGINKLLNEYRKEKYI